MISKVFKPLANGVHKSISASVFYPAFTDKFGDELYPAFLGSRIYPS